MRTLILFMHMSLDGYVAAADRPSGLGAADDDDGGDLGVFESVVPKLTNTAAALTVGRSGCGGATAERGG